MRTIAAMSSTVGRGYRGLAEKLPGAPRRSPALLAFAAFALLLAACGSEPLPGEGELGAASLGPDAGAPAVVVGAPAGTADAGAAAAPEAHAPQCQPLAYGDEFFPRAGDLVLNTKCDRVCRNTLGGATCIFRDTLELTDCDACQ
jgi:hypothetical protein